MGLCNPVCERPASVFWIAGDDHAELRGDDVEAFEGILADHMARSTAAADRMVGRDCLFYVGQMFGQ